MSARIVSLLALLLALVGCAESESVIFASVERDRLTLTAPANLLIDKVFVNEGQQVAAGTVLLTLDDRSAQALVRERHAQLQQAQAHLAELSAGARDEELARAAAALAGANAKLQEALQNYQRTARLYNTRVLSKADLDSAQASKDSAQAYVEQSEQSLRELQNGTRDEQLAQAQAQVAQAQALLEQAQQTLADLSLVAAHDAQVDTLPWRSGDRVAQGTLLVSLLATANPYARAYLPADKRGVVTTGSVVTLKTDDGRQYQGAVRRIHSQPMFTPYYALNERDRARLMYLMDIDLTGDAQQLPSGLNLEVVLP